MIIGLTGLPASGKATIANYLVTKYSYKQLVFSDIIKNELEKDNILSPKRENYKQKALELRQKYGDGALALLLIKKIKQTDFKIKNNYVLDGIRTMGEVKEIKYNKGQIWAVTAPIEKRLAWIQARNRDIDSTLTLNDLKKLDEKELYSANSKIGDLNLKATIDNADITLNNNSEIKHLQNQIESVLQSLSTK